MERQNRDLGIDCMRIVCMLLIVLYHIQGYGGLTTNMEISTVNRTLIIMLQSVYQMAIDGFALISGYIGYTRRHKYTSLVVLWMRVLFYSVGITAVVWLIMPSAVSYECIRNSFFPLITGRYWYFTAYAGCFVIAPLVCTAIEHLSRKEAKTCLAGVILVFSVFPYLMRNDPFFTFSGNHALWLLILYSLGAYVRKYDPFARFSTKRLLLLFAGACVVQSCSGFVLRAVSLRLTGQAVTQWYFICNDSPTTLVLSLLALALFSRLRIRRSTPLFRLLVSGSFSVYLIHDHPLIRQYGISPLGNRLASLPSLLLIPSVFAAALLVYCACACADMLREKLFGALQIRTRLLKLEDRLLCTMDGDAGEEGRVRHRGGK